MGLAVRNSGDQRIVVGLVVFRGIEADIETRRILMVLLRVGASITWMEGRPWVVVIGFTDDRWYS